MRCRCSQFEFQFFSLVLKFMDQFHICTAPLNIFNWFLWFFCIFCNWIQRKTYTTDKETYSFIWAKSHWIGEHKIFCSFAECIRNEWEKTVKWTTESANILIKIEICGDPRVRWMFLLFFLVLYLCIGMHTSSYNVSGIWATLNACSLVEWFCNIKRKRERKKWKKHHRALNFFTRAPFHSGVQFYSNTYLSLSLSFIFDLMAIIRHARFSVNSWACIYGLASL